MPEVHVSCQREVKFREKVTNYYLSATATTVMFPTGGGYSPSSITITAYKVVGGGSPSVFTSGGRIVATSSRSEVYSTNGVLTLGSSMLNLESGFPITVYLMDVNNNANLCPSLTITKIKEGETGPAGPKGEDGDDGEDAVTYYIEPMSSVINFATASSFNPDTLTLNAKQKVGNGTAAAYSGYFSAWRASGTLIKKSSQTNSFELTTSNLQDKTKYPITVLLHKTLTSAVTLSAAMPTAIAVATINCASDGVKGDMGNMGVPMIMCGLWDAAKTYFVNSTGCCYAIESVYDVKSRAGETAQDSEKVEFYAYRVRTLYQNGNIVSHSVHSDTHPDQDIYNASTNPNGNWQKLDSWSEMYINRLLANIVTAHQGTFDYLEALYCRFREVTVEGCINNLIVSIDSTNADEYGYYDSRYSRFYLNPLKTGSMVFYGMTTPIYLPIAYYNGVDNEGVVEGKKDVSNDFTFDELRQCVGKKFYFLNNNYTQPTSSWYQFFAGIGVVRLLQQRVDQYSVNGGTKYDMDLAGVIRQTPPDGYGGIPAADIHQRIIMCANAKLGWGYYFVKIECKLGMYDSHECIYWDIEGCGNRLE